MKTANLTGTALDWAVAKCEGHDVSDPTWWPTFWADCCYSTDWAEAGEIIERERINTLTCCGEWQADIDEGVRYYGATPLIAAMRCYVASKLGDEVELPEGLTHE